MKIVVYEANNVAIELHVAQMLIRRYCIGLVTERIGGEKIDVLYAGSNCSANDMHQ